MKIFLRLVPLLAFWIPSAICISDDLIEVRKQDNGEFEGTGDTSLGGADRLVPYDGDNCLSGDNLNQYCPSVNLPGIGLAFKEETYTKIHICNNGMLRFKDGSYQNWPRNFGLQNGRQEFDPCLAPYWARVDQTSFQTNGCSKVCYEKHVDRNNDPSGVFNITEGYGETLYGRNFTAEWVMVVTWKNVRPLNPGTFGGLNTFQVLLATDNTDSFAVYIYADIDWSVRAFKRNYANFLADYPPVVGWNAGQDKQSRLYRKDKEYQNFKHSGSVRIEEIDDELDNSLNNDRGKFGIKLGNRRDLSLSKCISWWITERNLQRFFGRPRCVRPCPPTFFLARFFDNNYRLEFPFPFPGSEHICFINRFSPRWNPTATRCCYETRFGTLIRRPLSLAGSSLRISPRYNLRYYQEEIEAKENCCIKNNFCGLYYNVRRLCTSAGWRPPRWAFGFGDPHFETLDGKNYTFNGCGWYTYFQGNVSGIGNSSLEVQVRTTKVGDANATAFTGIVLKEGTSETVQVNLKSTGGLLILIDGEEYSGTVTTNATTLDGGVSLQFIDGGETLTISTPLGNAARITETANGTLLTIVTSFSDDYRNYSKGLSGYWNGNVDDDFLLPNGTILPSSISDSQIHFDFGENWAVQDGYELYVNVSDDENFQCSTTFVPIFLDEALQFGNDTLKAEAEAICGNDVNCLFDIAVTGNTALGASTLSQVTKITNEVAQLSNSVPFFILNETLLNVKLGETFRLTLTAFDEDQDSLSFDIVGLPEGANFTADGNNLHFAWLVNSTKQVNFTFTVDDGKNGTDSLTPDIILCACQNGGTCFIPPATSNVTAGIQDDFFDMECRCPLGKTGRRCETQKDFCASAAGTVCHPLVACFNHPTNFTCGPCPTGYEGNGLVCSESDECISNNTNNCEQLCSNTAGSFLCRCNLGHTLDNDRSRCNDIDECSQPNDCAQECNNTIGSYECYCRLGFKISPNNTRECVAINLCEESNQCTQICYVDPISRQAKCDCNSGYVLEADGNTCKDVDECGSTETNLCDQRCINTMGSYTCLCNAGYSQSGRFSCSDINECLTDDSDCNELGEFCENLAGSFRCKCNTAWNLIRINGSCVFKSDPNAQADLAPDPPTPSAAANANAIRVKILNYKQSNWTVDQDSLFRDSVVKLVNEYCNENRLRPQDCGSSQNQLLFNLLHVQRLPGFPKDNGSDALLEFYINYPNGSTAEVIPRAILASIIFSQLGKLENETKLDFVLETSVTPPPPRDATSVEIDNAVLLDVLNFNLYQWTTFYDVVFRRAVAVTLNTYCNQDAYAPTECLVAGSQVSFNQTHIGRLPTYPMTSGANVRTSFYVNYPNGTGPMPKMVLASILTTARATLATSLGQQVDLVTTAAPDLPPTANSDEIANSVVVQIASFQAMKWTYLDELRFRKIVANRINSYCKRSSITLMDCRITSNQASFSLSDVKRTTAGSPSQNGNNADLSFYVDYPGERRPMEQRILASVIKAELEAIKQQSRLPLTLQTSYAPVEPPPPTSQQLNNTVALEILNIQANEWDAIQDNRLRKAVADALASYCGRNSKTLLACNIASDQTSFDLSNVTRKSQSPTQNGNNVTYYLFANYPSGSGPVPRNILAGILSFQLATINTATGLQHFVQTSSAASSPPTETPSQNNEAVVVVVSNLQANQWSAIQDNIFRGSVAQVITEYCNVGDARREECGITGGETTFTLSHVQRVQNSPSQNGSDAKLKFYASYPSVGGTVLQKILSLIMEAQLELLENKTGLSLTLLTTFVPPEPPAPNTVQNGSSIEVLLIDFGVNEWTSHRDSLFREKMAEALIKFCNASSFHLDLCNISQSEVLSFNASHIQRLPNSPYQSGSNAVLAFYANLPSGRGTVARNILSSAFVSRQEDIISVSTSVITSTLPEETQPPTAEQKRNSVAITIFQFSPDKFTSLQESDIRTTIAQRMNAYCFSAGPILNTCLQSARRRKRDITSQTQFIPNDVLANQNSVTAVGNNTQLDISVNQPGSLNPVSGNVVKDALEQSFQQDGLSDFTGLKLGITNTPTPTTTETGNAIEVVLNNFNVNQWLTSTDLSFRQNMTAAIIRFCNSSSAHLSLCNISREDLAGLTYLNIELLPNSPSQNGSDTLLSFYVDLPGGSGTLSKNVLAAIFSAEKDNIFSQPSTIETTSPIDSGSTSDQPVQMTIRDLTPDQFTSIHANDTKESIAQKLNDYCKDKSSIEPCTNGNFGPGDVILTKAMQNGSDTLVTFHVNYPGQSKSVSADIIRDILSPGFQTNRLKLAINVEASSTPVSGKTDDIDLPLILGLSIAGALIFIFVILAVILGSYKGSHQTKFRQDTRNKYRDNRYDVQSIHSSRDGWEFDRASPYGGSPFASIDAIPGFDEDGLPYEAPATNTQIY